MERDRTSVLFDPLEEIGATTINPNFSPFVLITIFDHSARTERTDIGVDLVREGTIEGSRVQLCRYALTVRRNELLQELEIVFLKKGMMSVLGKERRV